MFVRVTTCLTVLAVAAAFSARPSGGSGREQVYVVRPYDTLWSIAAHRYSGDPREGIWKIEQRNGLSGAMIRPGERLYIPR